MFIYKKWEEFCRKLSENGIHSITAENELSKKGDKFLILKHDVETNPRKALNLAKIESAYCHKGVYYVQAYLLNSKKNIEILRKIKQLGHEVSYHHDVMDSNKGDIENALAEFTKNKIVFENNGFEVKTVCQHGNPVIQREGYTSNRDFFRDEGVAQFFSGIAEIMVNFRHKIKCDYKYISDAGYGWKIIYDPENNDIVENSDKDIKLDSLDAVLELVLKENAVIISTHPHRWNKNKIETVAKNIVFKMIKTIARMLAKIPFVSRIMSRFYFLAKKI